MFNRYHWVLPIMFCLSVVCHFFFSMPEPKILDYYLQNQNTVYFEYLPFKDTVYYSGNNYITISLIEQKARIIWRGDSVTTFKISSGNQNIKLGQSTPEGFFTVQNKSPLATSKQFDNAELFNWIGFNGNVGFHGLKGSGYYGTLGFRPSSHGCVRISREDGQILYQKVSLGTPVIVYHQEPLRVIKFAKPSEFDPNRDYMIQGTSYFNSKLLNARIENIYKGNALRANNYKIFSDGRLIFRRGMVVNGDIGKVPIRQKMPVVFSPLYFPSRDNARFSQNFIVSDTSKVDFSK